MKHAVFVYDPQEQQYLFSNTHPFNPMRLELTYDLLRQAGALRPEHLLKPRMASEEELLWAHSLEYLEAVRALSREPADPEWVSQAEKFGLGEGDTPFFPGMHEAASLVAGGSIVAAEAVMSGTSLQALHLGGGLHHALESRGSGFCVYNDAAVAISYMKRRYGARVLYVDTDVHHGDGVQWSFYSDPEVCTLSIHETGKYLFPGTGDVTERGMDQGYGTCYNVPVDPYTEDDSWMECFQEALDRVIRFYRPDVIVSQHGCDAHAFDPLAHICCSMNIYLQMPLKIQELAGVYCGGRWIALGGGGYDIWRVVPRAWSLLWLVMSGNPLIRELRDPEARLPDSWIRKWQPYSAEILPNTWLDRNEEWTAMPRRQEIEQANRKRKELALMYLPK